MLNKNVSKKKKKTAKLNLPPSEIRNQRCSKHMLTSTHDVDKIFKAVSILTSAASQRDLSNISNNHRRRSFGDNSGCVKACCKHFCSRSRSYRGRLGSPEGFTNSENIQQLSNAQTINQQNVKVERRKLGKGSKLSNTAAFVRRMMADVQIREERNHKFEEYRHACCYQH